MVLFAGCKINIGLDVVARRSDGYHDIDTLMLPVAGLCDAVEVLPAAESALTVFGTAVECDPEQNLCMRALRLMQRDYGAGQARVYLHKTIPHGAGLGGGSSDAAAVIRGADALFGLGLGTAEMERAAARLGSDIPFFITGRPAMASGRGEILRPADNDILGQLAGKRLLIVKPRVAVSTAEAYAGIRPFRPAMPLAERLHGDIATWRAAVGNAFEARIFEAHPVLKQLKDELYSRGALYASMSGSGSALYGIFDGEPRTDFDADGMFVNQSVISFRQT